MTIQRKRVAKRLASGLLAGAMALGGLAISGGSVSAKTPDSPSTNRLAGDDRYETAVEIARTDTYVSSGTGPSNLVIASGEKPYDALAASSLAGAVDAPILLVKAGSIPESVSDYISDYADDIDGDVYVIGGTSAVSEDVFSAIEDLAEDATVSRVAGQTRYETACEIAGQVGVMDATDTLIIVNGDDDRWADALSVGALAASRGWPIVTTANGGLNDTAKDCIDEYLAQPGVGDGSFLIVGGPAVLPTSVESYLLDEDVPTASIQRKYGADRYQTNLMVNAYMVTNSYAAASSIALASGLAPWDALAGSAWAGESARHIVLVPGTTLGANATAIAGLASALSGNSSLYVLGGRAAVSDTAKATYIAVAKSEDVAAPTISGCVIGATYVTVTFPDDLSDAEDQDFDTDAKEDIFEKNGAAYTPASITDQSAAGDDAGANVFAPKRQVYAVTTGTLVKGDVIEFLGMVEGVDTPKRSFAGASCTVAADTVKPTFSFRAVTASALDMSAFNDALGLAESPAFILTSSEPIVAASLASAGALSWTPSGGSATYATLSAVAMNSTNTQFLLAVTASAAVPYEDDVVTINKLAIADPKGNNAAANQSAEVATDLVEPSAVLGAQNCVNTATAKSATGYGFYVRAANFIGLAYGVYSGPSFNSWKVKIVQSRGLEAPTVVADADAKTITVTADTQYHTGADVVTAAANAGLTGVLGSWTFTAESDDTLTATSAAGVGMGAATAGTMTCYWLLAGTEPFSVNPSSNFSTTVDGISIGSLSWAGGANTTVIGGSVVLYQTGIEKTGTAIIYVEGLTDASGTVADDFTITTSL